MTINNLSSFKKALEEELALLEGELQSVGRINPDNPDDWQATASGGESDTAEMESRATEITDFEDRSAIEFEFERRLSEVKAALERIANNTYGICEICGSAIESDRLHANPAARTCKAHRDSNPEGRALV